MENRYFPLREVRTADGENGPVIEGYFAVFGDVYEIFPGATESIAEGAFTDALNGDIRALYNHNHDIVLGRTGSGTLTLRQDTKGLWGSIKVNPNDSEAMNAYERIARGDISGASFGFDVESQEEERREDGSVHWTITKINPLYEISPCTFPAYNKTDIWAREKAVEEHRRQLWKRRMKERLKDVKSIDAQEED